MVPCRTTMKSEQGKPETNSAQGNDEPDSIGPIVLKRLRTSPLRKLPRKGERVDGLSISLRFEVRRPPSKYCQHASNDAPSKFETAYTLFRQRYPKSVPIAGRQSPKNCTPIEYAEWAIWKARERWRDATWDNWFLGFYEKLITSEALNEVCHDRCKSVDAAYALLGLLLREADRFEHEKRTGVLGEENLLEKQRREGLWRKADRDAKKLLKIQDLVKDLRFDYALEVNRDGTPGTDHQHHRKTLAEIVDGFLSAFVEETEFRELSHPGAAKSGRGRPKLGLTSKDMFCALVDHFVKKAFRGKDHIRQAIIIVKTFAPGLLRDEDSDPVDEANAFGKQLDAFLKKKGAIEEFERLVTIYKTDHSFPALMRIFQL